MSDRPPVDLSKVIKKTKPLADLVAEDLVRQRNKFNLTETQWKTIGRRPSARRWRVGGAKTNGAASD